MGPTIGDLTMATLLSLPGLLAAEEPIVLTPAGWTVMLVSVGTVLALVVYCVRKVLSLPPVELEDIKGPLEIDTRDTADAD